MHARSYMTDVSVRQAKTSRCRSPPLCAGASPPAPVDRSLSRPVSVRTIQLRDAHQQFRIPVATGSRLSTLPARQRRPVHVHGRRHQRHRGDAGAGSWRHQSAAGEGCDDAAAGRRLPPRRRRMHRRSRLRQQDGILLAAVRCGRCVHERREAIRRGVDGGVGGPVHRVDRLRARHQRNQV
jgi:hypothetical protein